MKIAIDESGDSGRKFMAGSSKWFVVAAAIVPEASDGCGPICQAVAEYRDKRANSQELHFSKNSHQQHLDFLSYMSDKDFIFASVAIDKRRLVMVKPYVLFSKISLMSYAIDNLFSELQPYLDSPIVLVDSNGTRRFNRALSRYMIANFGSKHKGDFRSIKEVRPVDSRSEPLVQLADYIAGAVRHHVDRNYKSASYELYLSKKGRIFYC